MDRRIKELIAIGASITANCQPCLEYHVGKARESGAADGEISEAIAVGKLVRKGAAGKIDQLASSIIGSAGVSVNKAEGGCSPG